MTMRGVSRSPMSASGRLPTPRSSPWLFSSGSTILLLTMSHAISFLTGTMYASNHTLQGLWTEPQCPVCPTVKSSFLNASLTRRITGRKCPDCPPCATAASCDLCSKPKQPIPKTLQKIAAGMAHTTKEDFTTKFDLGVPIDPIDGVEDRDVLIIYAKSSALPNKMKQSNSKTIDFVTADEATENCEWMHVITRNRGGGKNTCLALVPNFESYHLQTWGRIPESGPGGKDHPLRLVPRSLHMDGQDDFGVPTRDETIKSWKDLKFYFETYETVLAEVQKIVNKIKRKNTVIVMTCNHGQSELLMNFVCSARSRGLDTTNVLVFATDKETKAIAESIGLAAFYDEKTFGSMPKEAAAEYGDVNFLKMMMAKVICVHLTLLSQVDVLFQDVDVVWFKDPLPFFHNTSSPIYKNDAYFQDDGARSIRFAPYAANSGFYYLRNNIRTQNLMTQLVMAGDLVLKTYSHQQAMIQVINEQMSLHGLRAKVLNRLGDEFPGGYHFHEPRHKNFFKEFFQGKKDPIIFHMSWTLNKDNKILFLRQLGEWYVKEDCVSKTLDELSLSGETAATACCSAEALFSCHYQDKPSKFPCNDSPLIDKDGENFWGD